MSTYLVKRLLASTIGIGLAVGGVLCFSREVLAVNTPVSLPAANSDTTANGAGIQPVKVPEPATLLGLGLVAGSLLVTRRHSKTKV